MFLSHDEVWQEGDDAREKGDEQQAERDGDDEGEDAAGNGADAHVAHAGDDEERHAHRRGEDADHHVKCSHHAEEDKVDVELLGDGDEHRQHEELQR